MNCQIYNRFIYRATTHPEKNATNEKEKKQRRQLQILNEEIKRSLKGMWNNEEWDDRNKNKNTALPT